MLDYRLETFLVLCETMNYTKAARRLCITQPAVTQHIRFLETHYGCKLFFYAGKTLQLTEKGKRLLQTVHSLAYNSEKIRQILSEQETMMLRIGATKTIGEFLIAPAIEHLLKEKADCNLSLIVDNTNELLQALDQGELEFALLEGFFDKQKYGHMLYRRESFFGVCAAQDPLAERTLSMKDLFSRRVFVREPGSGTRAIFERYLNGENETLQSFKFVTEISDFSVIKRLVERQLGISFFYRPVVEKELEEGKLKRLQLTGPEIFGEFNFVYLKENLFTDEWKNRMGSFFVGQEADQR